ncbi:MAG: Acetyl-coenzyme A carboxylase carboxyl transferase subunit beta [Fimbriimonadales bacterium]|nr:MAG: acetyl-CoA carboxylase, carboxyltransferase subunit beta [Armatimonadota bacterium]MBV6503698.1 Acetyl-coenzyme A carboxylase carboxyl transferase subunit beta [Fimbriimonadales bacterium]MCE7899456.1 acetyl-CoA carboxylase, carboxyltransferase subunit beta [Armatimonadetes bacterium ATM1]MDL1929193.1 acetyl-CoA carboxylase, carboxyltransferase subunit beta [Fimbriimonadia bacterium ATM]MBC6970591.1 acetyl-CoA carboxylase, carboxyltransferase subunit beta [Armatimonadota bacterium]
MQVKSDAFLRCSKCRKVLFSKEFERNLRVCGSCGHHHRISADERIRITFDEGTFQELDRGLRSCDPLEFPDYREKLEKGAKATGRHDSVIRGTAMIEGRPVSAAVADFAFMGGSMGSVAGEKIARTIELAIERRIPAVIFTATGGARMQEGLLSLMQMAKTAAACRKASDEGVPFVCVFTDPTMAGVLASYASLADVILAEPGALVGFAGARVSAQAGVGRVPDNFQTSEYNFEHGMIDAVVQRKDLRSTLARVVDHLSANL